MKRKWVACVLVLAVLIISAVPSMANSAINGDSFTTINAPITSGTDLSASEWYSSDKSRAMLTISVSMDTISKISDADSDSYTSFWTNPSWVGISGGKRQVMVTGYYGSEESTTVLVMIYTPSSGEISYLPMTFRPAIPDNTAEMFCVGALETSASYEKNDPSTILSIISDLN